MKNVIKKIARETANRKWAVLLCCLLCTMNVNVLIAQESPDSLNKPRQYKNVVRYNLSGALLFGIDRYVVLGYERVIRKNQSISINFGKVSLPKLVKIKTDSVEVSRDIKS